MIELIKVQLQTSLSKLPAQESVLKIYSHNFVINL